MAHFIATYGWETWSNPTWPTADHVIPYKLMVLLLEATGSVKAIEQLVMANALAHGVSIAWQGKDTRVRRLTRKLARRAFPTVMDDDAEE